MAESNLLHMVYSTFEAFTFGSPAKVFLLLLHGSFIEQNVYVTFLSGIIGSSVIVMTDSLIELTVSAPSKELSREILLES